MVACDGSKVEKEGSDGERNPIPGVVKVEEAMELSDAPTATTDESLPITSSNVIVSRQFWRAGEIYGDPDNKNNNKRNDGSGSEASRGLDHSRVHPRFLHSNATSHKWAFGAIAELLDNAVDEIPRGATHVIVDTIANPRDNTPALIFQDNGGGMCPHLIRRCMSLGYSSKASATQHINSSSSSIGRYGNGFKTSTMRLGADVILFTRTSASPESESEATQSIGLLSYTFLTTTAQVDTIVPIIDFQLNPTAADASPLIRTTDDEWNSQLTTILQWSPYSTRQQLMQQFHGIGPHGTKIIVYNLWLNNSGIPELDFHTQDDDIQLRPHENSSDSNTNYKNKHLLQSHISYRLRYSLRAYVSILYLRKLPNNFQILLRGKAVEHHVIAHHLQFPQLLTYKPSIGGKVEISIGFIEHVRLINVRGFNVYHNNRLIMPFWRVFQDNSSRGSGVVGVLEANFIHPTHDKQDFERTPVFARLETKLKNVTLEYWKHKSPLIGYHHRPTTPATSQPHHFPQPPHHPTSPTPFNPQPLAVFLPPPHPSQLPPPPNSTTPQRKRRRQDHQAGIAGTQLPHSHAYALPPPTTPHFIDERELRQQILQSLSKLELLRKNECDSLHKLARLKNEFSEYVNVKIPQLKSHVQSLKASKDQL